jgi:hypothetical protein
LVGADSDTGVKVSMRVPSEAGVYTDCSSLSPIASWSDAAFGARGSVCGLTTPARTSSTKRTT